MGARASKSVAASVSNKSTTLPTQAAAKRAQPTVNEAPMAVDWTERPPEDALSTQFQQQLAQFRVQTTARVINVKQTKALETLRNRDKEAALMGKAHQELLKLPAGRLSVDQVQQLFGALRSQSLDQEHLCRTFNITDTQLKSLIQFYNIYETIGSAKSGLYGNWPGATRSLNSRPLPEKTPSVKAPLRPDMPSWSQE